MVGNSFGPYCGQTEARQQPSEVDGSPITPYFSCKSTSDFFSDALFVFNLSQAPNFMQNTKILGCTMYWKALFLVWIKMRTVLEYHYDYGPKILPFPIMTGLC